MKKKITILLLAAMLVSTVFCFQSGNVVKADTSGVIDFHDDFSQYQVGTNPTDYYDFFNVSYWSWTSPTSDKFKIQSINGNNVCQFDTEGSAQHYPTVCKLYKNTIYNLETAGVKFTNNTHGYLVMDLQKPDASAHYFIIADWSNRFYVMDEKCNYPVMTDLWQDKTWDQYDSKMDIESKGGDIYQVSFTRLDTNETKTIQFEGPWLSSGCKAGFGFFEDTPSNVIVNFDDFYVKGRSELDSSITTQLTTDMPKYIQGDIVDVTLKQSGIQPGNKTNSVTYALDYDGDSFELLDNDINSAVQTTFIPFNSMLDIGTGANKRILLSYLDINTDVLLQDGQAVFSVRFRVKDNPTPGSKAFTLEPVEMLDSDGRVLDVNNDQPTSVSVDISDEAAVDGSVSLYMGDVGTGLNNDIIANINIQRLEDTFIKNLKFILKRDASDPGTAINGEEVCLKVSGTEGRIATIGNGTATAKFRIFTSDTTNTILTVDGAGYLQKSTDIALVLGRAAKPAGNGIDSNGNITIYPGDIGTISGKQLLLTPDNRITNADFSSWLKIHKQNNAGTVVPDDALRADFTKDGNIDNIDFSLWYQSFKNLLQ